MADHLELKDPRKRQSLRITVVRRGDLEVIAHQRKPRPAHLKALGVAEKTSERALAKLGKVGGLHKLGHGVWQSVSQQQAA